MLLSDKYDPCITGEFFYNIDVIKILDNISQDKSMPHFIFYGPESCGKKTIIQYFLKKIFGNEINNIKNNVYKVTGSGNKIEEIIIKQSSCHIIIEPNHNNHDKYIVQDVIKTYASSRSLFSEFINKKFKVILINNIDYLSYGAQTSLRRTIELYAETCRFIMYCSSLSKIIEPLKSRCFCFRIPSPKTRDLFKLGFYVSVYENINISNDKLIELAKKSKRNTKTMFWLLELYKHDQNHKLTIDIIIDEIVEDIFSWNNIKGSKQKNIFEILNSNRDRLYNLIITTITLTDIIKLITCRILDYLKINDIQQKDKYIQTLLYLAVEYETRGIYGRKDINHLEAFLISIINNFYKLSKK